MGFLSSFSDGMTKTDSYGRRVFFPFGMMGRGRILPDQLTERRLRRFVAVSAILLIVVSIILSRVVNLWWGLALAIVGASAMQVYLYAQIRGFPISDTRLNFAEVSRSTRKPLFVLVFIGAVLTACSFAVLVLVPNTGWTGFGVAAFSLLLLTLGVSGLVAGGRG
jgi:hypothetical protein